MTPNDDFIGQLEGYLEEYEGSTPMPEDVRTAIRAQLPSINQRPAWWPARRFVEMNNTAKLALAAAAVVVAAILGIQFLGAGQNVGGPDLGDPNSPATTPSLTPRPLPADGELEPGVYSVTRPDWTPVPFSFTVPAGWANRIGFITKHAGETDEVMLTPWVVTHVYADACQWDGTLFEVGGSTDDMAAALAAQGTREVSGPTDVTLGGYPAKRIELSVPAGLDVNTCDDGGMRGWPSSASDETTGWIPRPDQTEVVYIIDVDGARVLIGTTIGPDASDQDVAELEGVIASVRFDP